MNVWEKNPVAQVLAGLCGVLMLTGLAINFAWRGPVSSELNEADEGVAGLPALPPQVEELGPKSEYDVVNNRPLFSENRRPVVIDLELADEAPEELLEQEVAEPPKVRLTGVVITPTDRVVTLTPEDGSKAVVIREGMPLDGEFVGWSVDTVDARQVSLVSARGEKVSVELAVYDSMIKAPVMPDPPPSAPAAQAGETPADGAAPSRADEIRERIRQRREELRAEAEQEADDQQVEQEGNKDAYRDAIRSMMNRQAQEEEETDDSEN